jgi:hypothetical protein
MKDPVLLTPRSARREPLDGAAPTPHGTHARRGG